MHSAVKRVFALIAMSAALVVGAPGISLAAHDSQSHDQHERLDESGNPGWDQMKEAPEMDGMMNSPPMHGAEHPGPGNQPDVVEEGPSGN